jgi:N-acetyl-anhydromuramyl-L-alanine amidase AmpD
VNNYAIYYARKSCRDASAHLWVGERGTVLCTADLLDERTWHASSCNPFSIGIEMVERSDGSVFSATIQTTVALVEWLCGRFGIPKIIPMVDGQHVTKPFSSVTKFRGIVGHRNQTGKHDPGNGIFDALFAARFQGRAP